MLLKDDMENAPAQFFMNPSILDNVYVMNVSPVHGHCHKILQSTNGTGTTMILGHQIQNLE